MGQSFNAGGFVPNFAEFFKYPFTQKIRGRDRPVPPSEISGRFKEYEDQLFNGGLASLGFSDVKDLNKLFNSNVEADFFARRNDNPYIIDAKAGYNDAQAGSYMNKIGPGGTFAKLKSNPKFLDFLTSKGVSVNNLREAMVFGNMGVLQEKTLSKKGLMKASGFVPNFGENTPGKIGEGARMEAYGRVINGEESVFKAPKKTGSRRGEAVVDAKEQEALSQQYSEALSKFPWFKVLKQKHVGGGVLKQPLVAGQTLSKVLRRAYPNYGERAISGALGSITKFFNKIGLPYDGFGLAGNIIIPEEHQKHLIEVLQKEPGNLYAKMFGHKGGLPPGSLNMIDYAKGFVPNFTRSPEEKNKVLERLSKEGVGGEALNAKAALARMSALNDADQKFITDNEKGILRAYRIGALESGSDFMNAKAGEPNSTYASRGGLPGGIADKLRGIVGKKGGRTAVFDLARNRGVTALAGGFVPNFAGEPSKLGGAAKALGIGAIRALIDNILGDGLVDSMEMAGLNNLTLDDAKMVVKVLAEPTKGKHRKAFERSLKADREMQKKFVAAGYASMPAMPARASGGFVPNFANYADSVMGLEENLSGNKATFHTSPFPHVRNSSQPTFSAAMADHGGLSNALKDSMKGQKAAGLMAAGGVPNFATPRPYKFMGKELEIDPKMASGFAEGSRNMAAQQAQAKAEFEKIIQALRSSAISAQDARKQFEDLKRSAGLTADSQKRLGAILDKNVKAAPAAGEKSGGIMGFIRGTDANGEKLEGPAATNRQLKLGAASMALSMVGSQITQFTAGKGGALEKTGQAIEGVTNAASYAAMGAVFGLPGIVGGAVLGLGVAAYKIFGNTEEKAAKAAEKSKELNDSIGLLGSGMTSLKDNIIALGKASTETEKVIIRQKIVQDKANVDALIDKIEKEAGKSGVGQGVAANIKTLREARGSDTGGDPDKNAEAIRQLDEYSKGLAEFKAAKADKKEPSLLPSITRTMQASGLDMGDVVEEYFTKIKELTESSQKMSGLASRRNAQGVDSKKFAELGEEMSLERLNFNNLGKALMLSKDKATLAIKDNLGEDFADPVYFRQILAASKDITKAKQQVAVEEKKTKFSQSNIQSYIDSKRESMLGESIGAQKASTALDFTDSANLIEREFQLSLRNALGNIDAFSKAFQETANAIKKIEEDAKRAEIGEEFKNLQEAQTDLVAEMERTKKRLGEGKEAGGEEYATDLNNIIDSKNVKEVLEKIGNLLDPLKDKEKSNQGLTESEKLRKDALQKTSDQIKKQTATAADTKQKTINNIDTKRLELEKTQNLIDAQSKYARTLSKINLSYQDLDFKIQEEIKGKNENASYALEGERLKRDFSSERMSAMGVTLSPAAAREDAYLESSRRKVEDYQAGIDASIANAKGQQDKFKGVSGEFEKEMKSGQGKDDIDAASKYNSKLSEFNTKKLKTISDAKERLDLLTSTGLRNAFPEEAAGLESYIYEQEASQFQGRTLQENRGEFLTNLSNDQVLKAPINERNVKDTITHISGLITGADGAAKNYLENLKSAAETYEKEIKSNESQVNAKKRYEEEVKKATEAFSENTREFREQANKLEIEKMKVENKLALDSSGRKIASEKYLSRFMGPDMAQGENAAAKISEDQRLAIQDYDETLSTKNADRDRQIALLENKAYEANAYGDEVEKARLDKQITDLEAQKVQDGKKRTVDIKKINDTAFRDQTSLTETREFDLKESKKALERNLAKTKRQDASEIYLSQAKINSENYLSRDIRSTMGEGGSAAAKIKEDANLQVMQSRAEVALKATDRQLQIEALKPEMADEELLTSEERADIEDKISKLKQQNVADGEMQVANEEKINALMIQRLETLKESRTLSAITNSFFVDLANASDPIANLQRDVKNLAGSMQKGFEDAFVSFVDGTASAGDAFKGFVRSIAKEMAAMSARFTANLITNSLSQLGGTAFQSAQSYFGGSQGGVVRAATGGHITGGSGVRDDIPAILTGGEYVIKKGSVNKYGVDFLEKINAQKFASGGQALSNQYTLGTFSGNYGQGDSETLRGAPTPLLGGVNLNGGSFTMGQYNIDPRLSNIALSDENNPQNRIREDMAELDMERKIAFDDYSSDKRRALENFQIQKDNAAQAALINAAIQLAMAGIAAKIGQMAQSAEAATAAKDIGNASAEGASFVGPTIEGPPLQGGPDPNLFGSKNEASIARGSALIGKGVTSITPGKFNFFSKSIEPKYNIGNTSLNPNQFNEFSKIQALQQQIGKFQQDAIQTKEANTMKGLGLDVGLGDTSRDTVNERIAKKVIQNTKDLEQLKKIKTQRKASGGFISDGSGTKDDVPALLMGGEYVISKPAVQKYGVDFMSRVNSGSLTGFARGGSVGDLAPLGSGGSSSTGGNEDLIESINNLSAKIQSQLDKTGGGAGGGAISNNIEININVSESGEVKGSNMSSGDKAKQSGTESSEEQKQEDNKKRQELAGMLQGMITSTLVKEQRKGGLLAR